MGSNRVQSFGRGWINTKLWMKCYGTWIITNFHCSFVTRYNFRWSDNSPLDYFPALTVDFTVWRSASCVYVSAPRPRLPWYRSTADNSSFFKTISYICSHLTGLLFTVASVWNITRCDEKHLSICVKPFNNFNESVLAKISMNETGNCSKGFIRYSLLFVTLRLYNMDAHRFSCRKSVL